MQEAAGVLGRKRVRVNLARSLISAGSPFQKGAHARRPMKSARLPFCAAGRGSAVSLPGHSGDDGRPAAASDGLTATNRLGLPPPFSLQMGSHASVSSIIVSGQSHQSTAQACVFAPLVPGLIPTGGEPSITNASGPAICQPCHSIG